MFQILGSENYFFDLDQSEVLVHNFIHDDDEDSVNRCRPGDGVRYQDSCL
jgi:hypothetical protein